MTRPTDKQIAEQNRRAYHRSYKGLIRKCEQCGSSLASSLVEHFLCDHILCEQCQHDPTCRWRRQIPPPSEHDKALLKYYGSKPPGFDFGD